MMRVKVTCAIKRALHQRAHAHDTQEGGDLFKITCELSTPIRCSVSLDHCLLRDYLRMPLGGGHIRSFPSSREGYSALEDKS